MRDLFTNDSTRRKIYFLKLSVRSDIEEEEEEEEKLTTFYLFIFTRLLSSVEDKNENIQEFRDDIQFHEFAPSNSSVIYVVSVLRP